MPIQYHTPEHGAVWFAAPPRGRLRFEGPDAAAFLHALVTNDVEGLPAGRGTYAAWLTPQGRMITDLRLLRDETGVWAVVPEGLAPALRDRFDLLVFSERVEVTNQSDGWSAWVVAGSAAARAAAQTVGLSESQVADLPVWGHASSPGGRVVRTDDTRWPTYEVWAAHPGGDVAPASGLDALRIEAGRPAFGVDMTTDTIPLEAGLLDRAISQTKGCYVGQEVVVRILHRGGGRVVRQLVALEFEPGTGAPPATDTPLLVDGAEVGRVTSAAVSPSTGRMIALGYVHRDHAVPGRRVAAAGGAAAQVTGLAG